MEQRRWGGGGGGGETAESYGVIREEKEKNPLHPPSAN